MANNVNVTPGTGDVVAAEDVGSVKFQKVKLIDATASSTAGTGTVANPFQVSIANTAVNSTPIVVTGSTSVIAMPTVTVNAHAVTNAGTFAVQVPTAVTGLLGTVIISNGTNVTVTGTTLVIQPTAASLNCVVSNGTLSVYQAAAASLNCVVSNGSIVVSSMPTVTVNAHAVTNAGTFAVQLTSSSTLTITGSTSVINTVAVTGSTTVIGITFPSSGSLAISATTAGTTILVPSTASNSIYITDIILSNGATAGWAYLGESANATAPTTTDIKIQNIYMAANGGMAMPINNPIKLTSSHNFLISAVSCTTLSAIATYYVAP